MAADEVECHGVDGCPISFDRRGWHLKREVQVGHIITTITVAAAVIMYISRQDQRIALIELAATQQASRDKAQDDAAQERVSVMRGQLDRLELKLDRLIERNGSADKSR